MPWWCWFWRQVWQCEAIAATVGCIQNIFYRGQQFLERIGFEQHLHGLQTDVQGKAPIGQKSCGHDDRQGLVCGVNFLEQLDAGHLRHELVSDQQIILRKLQRGPSGGPIFGDIHLVAGVITCLSGSRVGTFSS